MFSHGNAILLEPVTEFSALWAVCFQTGIQEEVVQHSNFFLPNIWCQCFISSKCLMQTMKLNKWNTSPSQLLKKTTICTVAEENNCVPYTLCKILSCTFTDLLNIIKWALVALRCDGSSWVATRSKTCLAKHLKGGEMAGWNNDSLFTV